MKTEDECRLGVGDGSVIGMDRRWAVCQSGTECVEQSGLGGDDSGFCQGLRHRGEETRLNSEGTNAGTSLSDP